MEAFARELSTSRCYQICFLRSNCESVPILGVDLRDLNNYGASCTYSNSMGCLRRVPCEGDRHDHDELRAACL